MALTDSVRDFCGLSSDFDAEVLELITACKADLVRVGVLADNIDDTDANIITACKLYAAYMRDINSKGQVYKADYEIFRNGLAENQSYITEAPDVQP